MRDEKYEFVLSAKDNPLKIGRGETGLLRKNNNDDVSMSGLPSLRSKSSKKIKSSKEFKKIKELLSRCAGYHG